MRARHMLEGQESLRPEDVPKFASLLQELTKWKDFGREGLPEHYRINSIAGGLAVLAINIGHGFPKIPMSNGGVWRHCVS